jgi:hypothetical protein
MSDQVTCKSCIHAIRGIRLTERISSWFFDPPGKFVKCSRTVEDNIEYDPVTGMMVVEKKLEYCSTQRKFAHDNMCGPDGIHWIPKHKKDLFKLMKSINNETN